MQRSPEGYHLKTSEKAKNRSGTTLYIWKSSSAKAWLSPYQRDRRWCCRKSRHQKPGDGGRKRGGGCAKRWRRNIRKNAIRKISAAAQRHLKSGGKRKASDWSEETRQYLVEEYRNEADNETQKKLEAYKMKTLKETIWQRRRANDVSKKWREENDK